MWIYSTSVVITAFNVTLGLDAFDKTIKTWRNIVVAVLRLFS